MSSEQLYKKADRADEVADLDLKDADMHQVAQHVYDAWLPDPDEGFYTGYDERHKRRAVQMLEPFRKTFKGEFNTGKLRFARGTADDDKDYKIHTAAEIYLSALVEGTDIGKLVVGKSDMAMLLNIRIPCMKGKTVEIAPDGRAYNVSIQDGAVLNSNEMHEVWADPKSTVVNFGSAWILGCYRNNGVYLNYGKAHSIGYKCDSGIFLDFGKAGTGDETAVGYRCRGGVFVTRTEPDGGFLAKPEGPVYGVEPKELEKDEELSRLMDEIEAAGKAPDVPKANEIARKIDAHVRQNYKPRKVA